MDEDKKRRLQELAKKQAEQEGRTEEYDNEYYPSQNDVKIPVEDSDNLQTNEESEDEFSENSERKFPRALIIIIICILFLIAGLVFVVFRVTSGNSETEEQEPENEPVETTDTEETGQINVIDIEDSLGSAEYEITAQSCEFGEADEFNGEYYPNIFIQIKNTGDDNIYLESAVYRFEDAEGNTVYTTDSGYTSGRVPQIVKPGDYGYFYMSYTPIEAEDIDPETCVLKPELTVKTTEKEPVYYDISDVEFTKDDGGCSISGNITNNTDEDNDFVEIYCIGFDSSGNPVGIEPTYITNFMAGDTDEFSQIMMFVGHEDEIDSWEVYAFPYQYEHDLT